MKTQAEKRKRGKAEISVFDDFSVSASGLMISAFQNFSVSAFS